MSGQMPYMPVRGMEAMPGAAKDRIAHLNMSFWSSSTGFGRRARWVRGKIWFPFNSKFWFQHTSLGPEDALERGEHLLYVYLQPEEHLQATETMSQHLAEASWKHKKVEMSILEYLWEFKDVFSKESFNLLPLQKPWHHAIELEPTLKPTNFKVHPLSPKEQVELDAFLKENLHTGGPSFEITHGFLSLLHQKEGWLIITCTGLPGLECCHDQEPVPDSTHLQTDHTALWS